MMQTLHRLIQKYDAATVFVFAATIVVIVELSLMRVLVPSPATAAEIKNQTLMVQVCTTESLVETAQCLDDWNTKSMNLSGRLSNNPTQWQISLISMHAFGEQEEVQQQFIASTNSRSQYINAADYAADYLSLKSVMTGRTMLANINGSIYREGDNISMRGGEIVMNIIELGSTYAVLQLAEHDLNGDTKRTLHLASNTKIAHGERMP